MLQTNNGYTPKDLVFGDEGRKKLISGINKMASAVKSTLGPGGNTVLIESPDFVKGITVTKDGVTVARAVDLFDPIENLAVRMMKEAADKTATSAGDGTTTSIVLTEAIVMRGTELIKDGVNRTEVLRHIGKVCDEVVDAIGEMAIDVTDDMIDSVATISANNDERIGKFIADAYREVGRSGIVTVERSMTGETYVETTKGMRFDRGYSSNLFINDASRDECALDNVYVLVSDAEISNILQIETVLKWVISEGQRLLIIAPCTANVVNTMAANVMKGNIKACIVPPPSFGYRQHELMSDIAVSLGAVYFSEKTGDDLSLITPDDLGHAARVVVSNDSTTLMRSEVKSKQEVIDEVVGALWGAHSMAKKKSDKDFILQRIAALTGGIGVIYVGGKTDIEQKELYDRVDDAVCAVRSAIEEGILPGGGVALDSIPVWSHMAGILIANGVLSKEEEIARDIMQYAMHVPICQILENAGMAYDEVFRDFNEITDELSIEGTQRYGYNVKTGEYGDMIEMGVVDPAKVTRSALQNAVSVATTILSTNAIITMGRSFEISNV